MFTYRHRLSFYEADPAGIMFFGTVYQIAHRAMEEFILAKGWSWNDWFKSPDFGAPIRSSECDYRAPLFPGRVYKVEVEVSQIGESSLTTKYTMSDEENGTLCCIVSITSVFIDVKSKKKIPIPESIRSRLQAGA